MAHRHELTRQANTQPRACFPKSTLICSFARAIWLHDETKTSLSIEQPIDLKTHKGDINNTLQVHGEA